MRLPKVTQVTTVSALRGAGRTSYAPGTDLPGAPLRLLESAHGLPCHAHAPSAVVGNPALAGSRNPAYSRLSGLPDVYLPGIGSPQASGFHARRLQPFRG